MKRLICLLLSFCFLSGCSIIGERVKDPVTFYYIRDDYRRDMGSVIGSEIREASGHKDDLPYLLALYSMGPSEKGLYSPFPANTRITPTEHTEEGIVLSLSEVPESMTDAEYTLVCVCLAMTCMELTDEDQITVICADRSVTINTENLMMYETGPQGPLEDTK